jgi:hemoglobin
MRLAHRGMRISESDWNLFLGHAAATLNKFALPDPERSEVILNKLTTCARVMNQEIIPLRRLRSE